MIVLSTLYIVAAQGGIGQSWRVDAPAGGGDVDEPVTGGPNRCPRNPIYLGIMGLVAGLTLAASGPLTVAALVISFVALNAIIASEEKYLKARFGAAYQDDARRVRRRI